MISLCIRLTQISVFVAVRTLFVRICSYFKTVARADTHGLMKHLLDMWCLLGEMESSLTCGYGWIGSWCLSVRTHGNDGSLFAWFGRKMIIWSWLLTVSA